MPVHLTNGPPSGIIRLIRLGINAAGFRRTRVAPIAALLVISALQGCRGSSEGTSDAEEIAWEQYASQLTVQSWNTDLEVSLAQPSSREPSGHLVDLLVMNRSDQSIHFPPGYGAIALVFSEADKQWKPVDNLMTYMGDGETLDPRRSADSNWAAITGVVPAIGNFSTPATLRVLIVGRLVEEGEVTQEAVGGFVDVELSS